MYSIRLVALSKGQTTDTFYEVIDMGNVVTYPSNDPENLQRLAALFPQAIWLNAQVRTERPDGTLHLQDKRTVALCATHAP